MLKSGLRMAPQFIRLWALELSRSFSLGRSMLSGLLVLLLVLLLLTYLVAIGVFLSPILVNVLEFNNVPSFLNQVLIFYFLIEFAVRFAFQKKPQFNLSLFLHLPVSRKGIIHFLLVRSLLTPFTLVPLILFLPVTIMEMSPAFGTLAATGWLVTILLISNLVHWFVLVLRNVTVPLPVAFLALMIWASPFVTLYLGIFSPGAWFAPFFSLPLHFPASPLLAAIICIISYISLHRFNVRRAYLDEEKITTKKESSSAFPNLFYAFGNAGRVADTELKLILRHKKSRSYLYFSLFGLLYGLIFYMPELDSNSVNISHTYLFAGIFVTGFFMIQYAQFFLSWNTSFFDHFMVQKNGLSDLIGGKMLILGASGVISYLLALPYVYFGWHILAVHTAAVLYNLGIGIHIISLMALWQPKPMDINKSAMFNYEGVGVAQFIMAVPIFIVPYFVYMPFALIFNASAGLAAVGLFGILGLLFHKQLSGVTVRMLSKSRHKISHTFRSSS